MLCDSLVTGVVVTCCHADSGDQDRRLCQRNDEVEGLSFQTGPHGVDVRPNEAAEMAVGEGIGVCQESIVTLKGVPVNPKENIIEFYC